MRSMRAELDMLREAVSYKMVDDGYTEDVARQTTFRFFFGQPTDEDVRAVSGYIGLLFWPVISNPTTIGLFRIIGQAIVGQVEKEIYRGRRAEEAAREDGDGR